MNITVGRVPSFGFLFSCLIRDGRKKTQVTSPPNARTAQTPPHKSARSSAGPSTPQEPFAAETRDCAKALPQATASMGDQRRLHMKNMLPHRIGGASLARAEARWLMKVTASSPQPISTPTTTRRQRCHTLCKDRRGLQVRELPQVVFGERF